MAYDPRSTHNQEVLKKFIETLQNDFKNLSSETKKKYPQIREVSVEWDHFKYFLKKIKYQLNLTLLSLNLSKGILISTAL